MAGTYSRSIGERVLVSLAQPLVKRYITRGGAARAEMYWVNDSNADMTVNVKSILPKSFIYPNEIVAQGAPYYYRFLTASGPFTNFGSAGGVTAVSTGATTTGFQDWFFNVADKGVTALTMAIKSSTVVANLTAWQVEAAIFYAAGTWAVAPLVYQEFNAGVTHILNAGFDASGHLLIQTNNGAGTVSFVGTAVQPLNTWVHCIWQINAGVTSLYVNGVLDRSAAYAPATFSDTATARFGAFTSGLTIAEPSVTPSFNSTADGALLHYQDLDFGTNLQQIDTFTLTAGTAQSRVYGAGTTVPLPEQMYLEYDRLTADSHCTFLASHYR